MKILIIGGTGTISSAITRQLAASGHNLWLLNRGNRKSDVPAGVRHVVCDIDDTATVLN
jgi:nucleoside-diphosphate-sugar epimerase